MYFDFWHFLLRQLPRTRRCSKLLRCCHPCIQDVSNIWHPGFVSKLKSTYPYVTLDVNQSSLLTQSRHSPVKQYHLHPFSDSKRFEISDRCNTPPQLLLFSHQLVFKCSSQRSVVLYPCTRYRAIREIQTRGHDLWEQLWKWWDFVSREDSRIWKRG